MFGRVTITLGIGPHYSFFIISFLKDISSLSAVMLMYEFLTLEKFIGL